MLIDLSNVATKGELHDALASAFAFPDGMGRNWDGFWDCITSDWPLPGEVVLKGLDHVEATLPEDAKQLLEILTEYNNVTETARCAVSVSPDYRCSMYYLLFEAVPTADACFGDGAKGGLVCCWVKSSSAREAHRVARSEIESSGWLIVSQEQIAPAVRADYGEDTSGLPYYEQACVDGMTFVFHTWSSDDEDDEDDGEDDDDDDEPDEDVDPIDDKDIPRA